MRLEVSDGRLSVPLQRQHPFAEAALVRHSFDLSLFPWYLARKVAPRVRVEVVADSRAGEPDVMALYAPAPGACGEGARRLACLKPDDAGVLTDSDALYHAIHAAFAAQAHGETYVGFTRYGRPPYAPLFALALRYQKYGRGLYLAGELLPRPWPALTASYAARPGVAGVHRGAPDPQ